jgi:type II secretory pathway component PulF
VAVLAAAGVLLFYLTPKLATLFASLDMTVPAVTQWLLAFAAWLQAPTLWLVAALTLVSLALLIRMRHNRLRDQFDALLLELPVIGEAIRNAALARFTGVLALLLQSGISLTEALAVCARTLGNRHLVQRIKQAGDLLAAGNTLSASFAQVDLFPPLIVRLLYSGERSGALTEAFDHAAWFFLRDAREHVARSLKLLEPILALLLGGLLAFLLLAVFLPVYQVIGEIRL